MTDYVPMYDNVGQREYTTPNIKNDVTYAKLSPDTLLKRRTVSEQYQVPVTDHGRRHQKKSGLLIATMSVLFTLLSIGTITSIILASIQFQQNIKLSAQSIELSAQNTILSAQLQETKNNMATMKEEITNLQGSLSKTSFNKCFKETMTCYMNPRRKILSLCETPPLLVNITGYYTMDIRCQHYSTYKYPSSLLTASLKRPTQINTQQHLSCLCNMVSPNASGHDQHVSPFISYASITCTMIITRCPIVNEPTK